MKNFNKIIRESVKKALLEMNLVSTDRNGETNLVRNQSINAWRMIYSLMDNVKQSMDYTYKDKNGRISNQDVDNTIDYIYNSIESITQSTIENK